MKKETHTHMHTYSFTEFSLRLSVYGLRRDNNTFRFSSIFAQKFRETFSSVPDIR